MEEPWKRKLLKKLRYKSHNLYEDRGFFLAFIISTLWLFVLFLSLWWDEGNRRWLYYHFDGELVSWVAEALFNWSNPFSSIVISPFQGMVSTILPYSPWWNPGSLALSLPFKNSTNYTISYAFYWIESFFSIFLLARAIKLSRIQALLAAQLFVIIAFPPFNNIFSFTVNRPLFSLGPLKAHLMTMMNIIFYLYMRLGAEKTNSNIICMFLILFSLFVSFATSHQFFIYLLIYGFIALGGTLDQLSARSIYWKAFLLLILGSIFWFFHISDYYNVLAEFSARTENTPTLIKLPETWNKIDFCAKEGLFGINILSFFCPPRSFFSFVMAFAFVGALLNFFNYSLKHRWLAFNYLIISLLPDVLSYCFRNSIITGRIRTIVPFYLGWASLSFTIIFFVLFLYFLREKMVIAFYKIKENFIKFETKKLKAPALWLPFKKWLAVFLLLIFIPLIATFYKRSIPIYISQPTPSSIVSYLEKNASIVPNGPFCGSVASFFNQKGPLSELTSMHSSDPRFINPVRLYLMAHYGIYLSILWKHNIPTLEEFGQTITIPMAYFFRELFDGDLCNDCNYLSVFKLDLKALRALGVRYLITDEPMPSGGVSCILTQSGNQNGISFELIKKQKELFTTLLENENGRANSDEFIEKFTKELSQISILETTKEAILNGLRNAFSLPDKEKLSDSDYNSAVQNHFFSFLYNHSASPNIYLYEIQNPNLATFSPTQPVYLTLAKDMFNLMKNADYSFEQSVIVQDKDIPSPLVAAKNTQMRFKPNEVLVTAESEGWSLLLLPVQYSHCFQVTPLPSTTSPTSVRLMRANLIQSALLFQGKVDVSLKFNFNVTCRADDVAFWKSAQALPANKKN